MIKKLLTNTLAGLALGSLALAPLSAFAQGRGNGRGNGHGNHGQGGTWNPAPPKKNGRHDNRDWNKGNRNYGDVYQSYPRYDTSRTRSYNGYQPYNSTRRQQTKNEWRNLAIGAGLIGVLGLLKHDSTLTFAGAAGALYSAYRYEQDRKSQSREARARAYYFSQPYFYRDGVRYDRRTVQRSGQRYYQFVRR